MWVVGCGEKNLVETRGENCPRFQSRNSVFLRDDLTQWLLLSGTKVDDGFLCVECMVAVFLKKLVRGSAVCAGGNPMPKFVTGSRDFEVEE